MYLIQAPVVKHLEAPVILLSLFSPTRLQIRRKKLSIKGIPFITKFLFVIFYVFHSKGGKIPYPISVPDTCGEKNWILTP